MINEMNQRPACPSRGQIYVCNLGTNPGSVQDGNRPVLVVQANDICKTSPTVIIAPITSVLKRTDLPGHILLPEDCEALHKPSMVILEQMRTVNVSELGYYCGMLRGDETWKQINIGIKKVLGLWYKNRNIRRQISPAQMITCLCPKCVEFYWDHPASYNVKRLTPIKGAYESCDRCGYSLGVDYLITEKGE